MKGTDEFLAARARRAHFKALFGVESGLPSVIQIQHARLESAIRQAGLENKLAHLLNGIVADHTRWHEPFELFVVGEGKFGKSTLVNALLGDRIAPTDITPKTWCFNRYVATHSPPPYVRVFISESLRRRQDCRHLDRWLCHPREVAPDLVEYHVPREDAVSFADEEEQRVGATRGRPDSYWSPVMEMEWALTSDRAIVPNIRLVDTMGINQDGAATHAHRHYLRWQYARADAVLWLVSYDRLNAAGTRDQLREARRYSKIVYVLITRWDKAQDREALLARAQEHYGSLCTAVLPVSALAALAAQGLLDKPSSSDERSFIRRFRTLSKEELRNLSGFDALTQALQQFLDGRQRTIRNMQIYSALRQKSREFRRVAEQVRKDAIDNLELHRELQARTRQAYNDSKRIIAQSFGRSRHRLTETIERRLEKLTYNDISSVEDQMGTDRIDGQFRQLQRRVERQIEQKFASVVRWASSSERSYKASEFGPTGAVAEVIPVPSMSSLQVRSKVSTFSPSLFTPPEQRTLWEHVLGWLHRLWRTVNPVYQDQELKQVREKVRDAWLSELNIKLGEAKEHLMSEADTMYDQLRNDIEAMFERAGGEVSHQITIDRISEVLNGPTVQPVLVLVPTRLMRLYDWRR